MLKVKLLVTQSCPILCTPMDCSPPGSSVFGILQARILEWVAIPFSRTEPRSSTLQADSLPSEPPGKPWNILRINKIFLLFLALAPYSLHLESPIPPASSDEYYPSFSSCQSLNHIQLFVTPWTVAHQASLSITNSWSLLKLMSIESVMLSNHLILCCPLLLPSVFSSIRVFFNESVLHIR